MTEAEHIKEKALELSDRDRAELAHLLLLSLDEKEDDEVEAAWDAELDRRLKGIESGESSGRDAFEVLSEIRKKYE